MAAAFVVPMVLGFTLGHAYTAANAVPDTRLGHWSAIDAIGPNDIKPPFCDPLTLTGRIISGTDATGDGDLVLGTSGTETLRGNGFSTLCLHSGAYGLLGDTINAGNGSDTYCISVGLLASHNNCAQSTKNP